MDPLDFLRELDKIDDALDWASRKEAGMAKMNAAQHCNDKVMYSPLYSRLLMARDALIGLRAAIVQTPSGDPNASIRYIYEESGLTWDQVAKVFGVSRRAVHHWAAGGRMNAHHAEVALRLERTVEQLPAIDRDGRRRALLALGEDGRSIVDSLQIQAAGVGRVSGPQLSAAELLGEIGEDE